MRQMGFTLFELILVVVITAILAVSALPLFFDIKDESRQAAIDGIVGNVRDGIAIYRANDLVINSNDAFPNTLDSNADNSPCSNCFSDVLSSGLSDPNWRKEDDNTYSANDSINVWTYVYNSTDGTFKVQ